MAKGIKWDGGPYTGTFFVYGAFDCRTSPYRPAAGVRAESKCQRALPGPRWVRVLSRRLGLFRAYPVGRLRAPVHLGGE